MKLPTYRPNIGNKLKALNAKAKAMEKPTFGMCAIWHPGKIVAVFGSGAGVMWLLWRFVICI